MPLSFNTQQGRQPFTYITNNNSVCEYESYPPSPHSHSYNYNWPSVTCIFLLPLFTFLFCSMDRVLMTTFETGYSRTHKMVSVISRWQPLLNRPFYEQNQKGNVLWLIIWKCTLILLFAYQWNHIRHISPGQYIKHMHKWHIKINGWQVNRSMPLWSEPWSKWSQQRFCLKLLLSSRKRIWTRFIYHK